MLPSRGPAQKMMTEPSDVGMLDDAEEDTLTRELKQFEERPQPQRFRRKSVLPVDETVQSELSRHKSLEDLISKGGKALTSD